MKKFAALVALSLASFLLPQSSASAADATAINAAFTQLVKNANLANPAVIVLDEKTGEVVFEKNAISARKPASVIKLLSATAAYRYLSPSDSYTTSLWQSSDSSSVVIQGQYDPWICDDHKVALKMHRTSLGQLSWNILDSLQRLNSGDANEKTIYYSNFYPEDIALIQKYFKVRKIKVNLKRLSESAAKSESAQEIMSSTSPTLKEILDWTLTWSDNVLADRIARAAAYSAGFTRDHDGISRTFHALMNELGINDTGLIVKDGSGLSKENRVTAKQISELLMFLAHNEKYSPLLAGLPIGGETGTLAERFIDTAPNAIGLVRAKTGTLNGTTNLAGFVQSADHEYIFVIIADQHSKSYTVTKRVRATVDRILGKIAKPLLPELIQIAPSSESATTLSN